MVQSYRHKQYWFKRIARWLRVPAICLLLMMLSNHTFSQGLSITGTIEATNAQVSGTVSAGLFSGAFGALNTTGNIKGASLTITNNAFFGGSLTATGTISAAAITTSGGVIVGGNLSATGTITAQSLTTAGGIIIGAGLTVTGSIAGRTLSVTNTIYTNNLSVVGTLFANSLSITGGVAYSGNLTAAGTISAQSLTTAGGIIVGAGVTVTGTVVAQNLSVSGTIYANNLSVTGVLLVSNLSITGNIQGTGNLTVTGGISARSLSVTEALYSNSISTTGNIQGSGNLTITGGISTRSLSVTEVLYANDLSVTGDVSLGGNLTLTGGISTRSLSVTDVLYANDLSVTGDVSLGGNLTVTGGIKAASLSITGPALVGGTLSVTGNITTTALSATSGVYTNALSVTGNAAISGDLTVTGGINADNINLGFSSTVSTNPITLTVSDKYMQEITGSTGSSVTLPNTATLPLGFSFAIFNNSTANTKIYSQNGNIAKVLPPNAQTIITVVSTSLNTAAAWNQTSTNSFITGGGVAASLTSVNVTAGETVIASSVPLAVDRILAGTIIRVTLEGQSTVVGARVHGYRVRMGTLGTTADAAVMVVSSTGATGTGINWRAVLELTVRDVGASANVMGMGVVMNSGTTGIQSSAMQVYNGTMSTINTTTSGNIISCTVMSSGGTSATTTIKNAFIEIVNR